MKHDGYTLLEMLVIMAILFILLSIAAFSYTEWTARFSIESQIKEMYADLMTARARAMTRNRAQFVNMAASSYTIRDDTNENGKNDAGDALLFHKRLENRIAWNGSPEISFNTRGLSSDIETISVPGTVKAAYDCIVIHRIRINMGKMNKGKCQHR